MRTAGVFLIFAAVALRGAVVTSDAPYFMEVLGFLAAYGLLLLAETWLIQRKSVFQSRYAQLTYLLLQSALVIGLLLVSEYEDFFANLFIPLSLDAVSFFGRRFGYYCIAVFSLALTSTLFFSDQGQIFGLAMGGLYSGVCLLFGGYASQVLKAQAAHKQNRRTFSDLQIAHRQLQGYTDQVANLAVEHERNRLARELHDSVTQTVFSMNLAAQSARLLLDKAPPRVAGQLIRLEELAANALREIEWGLLIESQPHRGTRILVAQNQPADAILPAPVPPRPWTGMGQGQALVCASPLNPDASAGEDPV